MRRILLHTSVLRLNWSGLRQDWLDKQIKEGSKTKRIHWLAWIFSNMNIRWPFLTMFVYTEIIWSRIECKIILSIRNILSSDVSYFGKKKLLLNLFFCFVPFILIDSGEILWFFYLFDHSSSQLRLLTHLMESFWLRSLHCFINSHLALAILTHIHLRELQIMNSDLTTNLGN